MHKVTANERELYKLGLDFLKDQKVRLIEKWGINQTTCLFNYKGDVIPVTIPIYYLEKV